jgi:O-antigen/teichoic acid export membrane protein
MIVNIVGPIILYSDRFIISSILSLTAVTFYSTPYEMITKLLILPTAFVGVLFPAFSASYASDPQITSSLLKRSAKFIFILLFPIVFIITTFSYEGLYLWLDSEFARNSLLVLQYLSIGILFSSLSSIPNNFFQGIGKPNIPAILNLIELPIYLLFMYLFIQWYGIVGAAFFWMLAAGIDAIINYLIVYLRFRVSLDVNLLIVITISLISLFLLPFNINDILVKILISILAITMFIIISWKLLINQSEKVFLLERFSKIGLN